jgi:CheY-like chemotaxis protein
MKRILIVDDESGFTRLLKLTLERTGRYEVREENDGTRAIQTAREFQPDLILLDIMMPYADGGDIAARMRKDPRFDAVPIIFLTAIVSPSEAGQHSGEFGGFSFLAKPISIETLTKCLDENLGA